MRLALSLFLVLPFSIHAQTTIAEWTFTGNVTTTALGNGTASSLGGISEAFAAGNGGGTGWNTSSYPTQSTGNATAGVRFDINTTGYTDLLLSFDHRSSGTASRWSQIDYTLDGGSNWVTGFWNNNGGLSPHDSFYTFNVDFTSITGANDNADFGFRILSIFSPLEFNQNTAVSYSANTAYMRSNADADYTPTAGSGTGNYTAAGTWRFDNVLLKGTLVGASNVVWDVAGGGVWDAVAGNWLGGSPNATLYKDGDSVTFSNTAGGVVDVVAGGVTPSSVTVSADSGTYEFTGSEIGGTGSLAKTGNGTLVLSATNTYAGGTTIGGGIIEIDAEDRLGSGTVTLDGGSLVSTSASDLALPNTFSVGVTGGTIDTGAQSLSIASSSSIAGILTKAGSGNLTLLGSFSPGAGGGFAVDEGNFVLAQASGTVNLATNNTLDGNLVLQGPIRLNVNNGGSISGTGEVQLEASGTLISQLSGDLGGSIDSDIVLNSTETAFAPGSWSGSTYTPGTFLTTIGGTAGGGLVVNGVISGDSDVDLSNNSNNGGGSGMLTLSAQNTYTGQTTVNANTPSVDSSVRWGIDDALPTTTGVIAGTKTGLGEAVFDLNGFDQEIAYLADGGNVTGASFLMILNNGGSASELAISGSETPGTAFSGLIVDGVSAVSVVLSGTNTQSFATPQFYSAGTRIGANATLALVGDGTAGTGSIAIADGGTLDITGLTAGTFVMGPDQTLSGSGTFDAGGKTIELQGTLAPGSSPGSLYVTGSMILSGASDFEIDGITSGLYDYVDVSDTLTFGGVLNLTTGYAAQIDDVVQIFDAGTFMGAFSSVTGTDLSGGLFWSFDASAGTLTVIPEPGTLTLIGIGSAFLLCRSRRRRA